MKKVILCSCLVAALLCCLIVPSFAADWFSGSGVVGYTLDVPRYGNDSDKLSALASWLTEVGAVSSDTAIGVCDLTLDGSQVLDKPVYADNGSIRCFYRNTAYNVGFFTNGTFSIDSSTGYSTASSLPDVTVTDIVGTTDGFVSFGFTSALGIAGTVVDFCTSNTYVLIAIGLAVGVPLVGWGISKLKSLIKGY